MVILPVCAIAICVGISHKHSQVLDSINPPQENTLSRGLDSILR